MKIKQLPADLIVEEIPNHTILNEKDMYTISILEKQKIDTFDALRRVAKHLNISLFEIVYSGF